MDVVNLARRLELTARASGGDGGAENDNVSS